MNEEQLLDLYHFRCLHAGATSGLWVKNDIQVAVCYTRHHVSIFKINGVMTILSGRHYADNSELLSIILQYI